jgi:folate-dependent phosphoribosylglycinamide formyltransferase PurN
MKLWIFSNHSYGYGEEICQACVKYCVENEIRYEVVFSSGLLKPRISRLDWSSIGKAVRNSLSLIRYIAQFKEMRKRLGFRPSIVDDVNSRAFYERIDSRDVGIIAGFNQIFRSDSIGKFHKLINVHPSVLPLYRGPIPSYWCIKNGENQSGYTVHHVTPKIDSGEIIYQEPVNIRPGTTEAELDLLISRRAASVMPRVLSSICKQTELQRQTLDAQKIYRVHTGYAGFRER